VYVWNREVVCGVQFVLNEPFPFFTGTLKIHPLNGFIAGLRTLSLVDANTQHGQIETSKLQTFGFPTSFNSETDGGSTKT
jgi:hypothetical protein